MVGEEGLMDPLCNYGWQADLLSRLPAVKSKHDTSPRVSVLAWTLSELFKWTPPRRSSFLPSERVPSVSHCAAAAALPVLRLQEPDDVLRNRSSFPTAFPAALPRILVKWVEADLRQDVRNLVVWVILAIVIESTVQWSLMGRSKVAGTDRSLPEKASIILGVRLFTA